MPETPEHSEARPSIVFDTTVLSNFAVIDQIPLLEKLYRDRAYTTLMVVEEIESGLLAGYGHLRSVKEVLTPPQPAGWLRVLTLESVEEQILYIEFSSSLGTGAEANGLLVHMIDLRYRSPVERLDDLI